MKIIIVLIIFFTLQACKAQDFEPSVSKLIDSLRVKALDSWDADLSKNIDLKFQRNNNYSSLELANFSWFYKNRSKKLSLELIQKAIQKDSNLNFKLFKARLLYFYGSPHDKKYDNNFILYWEKVKSKNFENIIVQLLDIELERDDELRTIRTVNVLRNRTFCPHTNLSLFINFSNDVFGSTYDYLLGRLKKQKLNIETNINFSYLSDYHTIKAFAKFYVQNKAYGQYETLRPILAKSELSDYVYYFDMIKNLNLKKNKSVNESLFKNNHKKITNEYVLNEMRNILKKENSQTGKSL